MPRRVPDFASPRAFAPRSVASLLPTVTKPSFRRRSPASARIFAEWPALVGASLAERASPRRLAGGTLTLACAGPTALELQHLAAQVIQRINAGLGSQTVARLAFVQAATPPARPKPPRAIRPRTDVLAGKTLPDGPVGDALRALACVLG